HSNRRKLTAVIIVISSMPARRSASSSKTFTIDNDCTRPWAIARQPSLKQCCRRLRLIHGVINKPRQQQQTQQVPSFRVSAKGCTPLWESRKIDAAAEIHLA